MADDTSSLVGLTGGGLQLERADAWLIAGLANRGDDSPLLCDVELRAARLGGECDSVTTTSVSCENHTNHNSVCCEEAIAETTRCA